MTVITLLTDFGLDDGSVGAMKGVIWGIAAHAQIADLSHTIDPQNIPAAALILARSFPYFPKGSIHVVVVDPGAGTARRPLAARLGNQHFVAPDNGVLTLALAHAESKGWPVDIFHLNKPQFWLPDANPALPSGDIFAPVAGHLAAGVPVVAMGRAIKDPVRLVFPTPEPVEVEIQPRG